MRVLAVRFSALGDVAMTLPVILQVLEQNPEVEIDFLTRPFMARMLPQHPRLRAIGADVDKQFKGFLGLRKLSKELKTASDYDGIADIHNVLRSQTITYFTKSPKTKVARIDKGRREKKELTRKEKKVRNQLKPTTERYADVFRSLGLQVVLAHKLHPQANRNGIGFAPFAQHRAKSWPLDYARELLEKLNSEGQSILLFGAPDERKELAELSKGLDHISIHKGKGLSSDILAMKGLELMISMDSANMHLASLAGIPVISIWGATHPDAGFLGYGQSEENVVQVSTEELDCRPCSVFGNEACWRGDYACMNRIDSTWVFDAVQNQLKKQSTSPKG